MEKAANQGAVEGLDQALRVLDWKVNQHPTYPDVLNLRGLARAYLGDLEGSRDDLVEALRLNPKYEAALVNLAWVHVERNEPGAFRAIRQGRQVQNLDPTRRLHLEFLEALRWRGPEAALALLDAASDGVRGAWWSLDRLLAAVRAEAWPRLSQDVEVLMRERGLRHHFERLDLVRDGQVQAPAWRHWADRYRGNPQAARLFQKLHELVVGDEESALRTLDWSVAISLDVCSYWLESGAHYEQRFEDAAAEAAYLRACDVDRSSAEPHVSLGLLYSAQGRGAEAMLHVELAAKLRPRYANIRYLLGQLYEDNGWLDKAEAEYRAAIAINPNYVLATLALGSVLAAARRDEEATTLLERVRETGLESVDVDSSLAMLYERMGRNTEAEQARRRAEEIGKQLAVGNSD
jgi:Flp pilus assembly protein TadD